MCGASARRRRAATVVSEAKQIRAWLEDGNTLTPLQALRDFDCYRLSAVIFNLRKAGVPVVTRKKQVTKANGRKAVIAEYYIEKEQQA